MQQTRSKVFLSTDEIRTIEYVKEIGGQVMRGLSLDEHDVRMFETVASRDMEVPYYPVRADQITFGPTIPSIMKPLTISRGLNSTTVDTRFILKAAKLVNGAWQQQDNLPSQQAGYWRADDHSRQALLAHEKTNKFTVDDLKLVKGSR